MKSPYDSCVSERPLCRLQQTARKVAKLFRGLGIRPTVGPWTRSFGDSM